MESPPSALPRLTFHRGDVRDAYPHWPAPACIVSDGAYGVAGFPGDPPTPSDLAAWYRPHARAWAAAATGRTTLWFWNTEVGWATVHPELLAAGWTYVACNVWNKGPGHVAGNVNTATLRRFPVVTEVCAHYVRAPEFPVEGEPASMQTWLRAEWRRTGLPGHRADAAAGVKGAATRKYLVGDHRWYMPPPEAFAGLAAYANAHGDPAGRPYFSLDNERPLTADEWARMRAKFALPFGVTNVWGEPAVRGAERLKTDGKAVHGNQKPLRLLARLVEATTDPGEVVWEPFGGLCSASAPRLSRRCAPDDAPAPQKCDPSSGRPRSGASPSNRPPMFLPIAYELAVARHPAEVEDVLGQIRKSRSKFRADGPFTFTWGYWVAVETQSFTIGEVLAEMIETGALPVPAPPRVVLAFGAERKALGRYAHLPKGADLRGEVRAWLPPAVLEAHDAAPPT